MKKKCKDCGCVMNDPDDDYTNEVTLVGGSAGNGKKIGICKRCYKENTDRMFR